MEIFSMASLQEGVAAKIRGNLAESLPLIRLQGAASAQREGIFWAWKNRCARIPSLLTAIDDRSSLYRRRFHQSCQVVKKSGRDSRPTLSFAPLQQARQRDARSIAGPRLPRRLLDSRVVPGRAEDRACWLLKLEFCQLRGQLEVFEEVAINYAVTFEISPPSWEPERVAAASRRRWNWRRPTNC
jgi:hypothetical protein